MLQDKRCTLYAHSNEFSLVRYNHAMNIQTVTITVSDMKRAKAFYEDILGFKPDEFYEPTSWQPYRFNNQLFGIREKRGFVRPDSFDIANFETDNVEELWASVENKAKVVEELAPTPWGSYRFVVQDPDGYNVAFVAKRDT